MFRTRLPVEEETLEVVGQTASGKDFRMPLAAFVERYPDLVERCRKGATE